MRGVWSVLTPLLLLFFVGFLSRSSSVYRGVTWRVVVRRLVGESERCLSQDDRNLVVTLVARATARAWAQAAAVLVGEDGVRDATGVDVAAIVDRAQRDMDSALSSLNMALSRKHRVGKDQVLAMGSLT